VRVFFFVSDGSNHATNTGEVARCDGNNEKNTEPREIGDSAAAESRSYRSINAGVSRILNRTELWAVGCEYPVSRKRIESLRAQN